MRQLSQHTPMYICLLDRENALTIVGNVCSRQLCFGGGLVRRSADDQLNTVAAACVFLGIASKCRLVSIERYVHVCRSSGGFLVRGQRVIYIRLQRARSVCHPLGACVRRIGPALLVVASVCPNPNATEHVCVVYIHVVHVVVVGRLVFSYHLWPKRPKDISSYRRENRA